MIFDNEKELSTLDIGAILLLKGKRTTTAPVLKKKYAPDGYVYQNKRFFGWDDGTTYGEYFDVYYNPDNNRYYLTTELNPDITITATVVSRELIYLSNSIGQYMERLQDNVEARLTLWGGNGRSAYEYAYEQFENFARFNLPENYKTHNVIELKGRYTSPYTSKTNTKIVVIYVNYDTQEAYFTTYMSYFATTEPTRTITKNNVERYIDNIDSIYDCSWDWNIDYYTEEIDEDSLLATINLVDLRIWYYNQTKKH